MPLQKYKKNASCVCFVALNFVLRLIGGVDCVLLWVAFVVLDGANGL